MKAPAQRQLHMPSSLAEALEIQKRFGAKAEYFAGGTWIMRADLRQESEDRHYICLSKLYELDGILLSAEQISVGALVTHARIAEALSSLPDQAALARAAGKSANPAIRRMATIGGNICTSDFAAADLVPALICLSATVELLSVDGKRELPIEEFLHARQTFHGILTKVSVPREDRRSAHARLPLKKAGDYPACIVSVSAAVSSGNELIKPKIAIGSVEPTARRWKSLEEAIAGKAMRPETISALAKRYLDEFNGRDGLDAPGWYRTRVLPELVRRAFTDILVDEREQ